MTFNLIVIACREIKEWTKDQHTPKNLLTLMDKTLIRPEPYGVVLVIGSWNYPLHLSMSPLHAAIAAGNCGIVKPSELAPNTAEAIGKLLPRYIDSECIK